MCPACAYRVSSYFVNSSSVMESEVWSNVLMNMTPLSYERERGGKGEGQDIVEKGRGGGGGREREGKKQYKNQMWLTRVCG